jgi:hypothetical protein
VISTGLLEPDALRRERVARPWRIAFVLFTLALIIGTHLPGPAPEDIQNTHASPDKFMHFVGFGAFTILLWMTGWIRWWWITSLIAIGFVIIDEWTQSVISINRESSGSDIAAGVLGVLAATGWLTALSAAGDEVSQIRNRRGGYILESVLSRTENWFLLGLAGIVPFILVAVLTYAFAWNMLETSLPNISFSLGMIAGIIAGLVLLKRLMEPVQTAMRDDCPCFFCGVSTGRSEPDADGWMECPSCRRPVHQSQWRSLALPRIPLSILLASDGLVGFACVILYIVISILVGPAFLMAAGQPGLAGVIACTGITLLAAMFWTWRQNSLAMVYHDLGSRCVGCAFDLSSSSDHQGVGSCPDCGLDFARFKRRTDEELGVVGHEPDAHDDA